MTEPDDFILDFFAGSGSTAHAVMEVNKEEGSDRKFLLIEKTDFVEEMIIPRLQKVMEDEVIQFCTLSHQVQRNEHFYS